MNAFYFSVYPSDFGNFSIVWKELKNDIRIQRIFLSNDDFLAEDKTREFFISSKIALSSKIDSIGRLIQQFLSGKNVSLTLDYLDFAVCTSFQKKVLLAEYNIPRGLVSTYGRIAKHLGIISGARAVGNALATNPFPILIPCHRAIRSTGALGGYQGGLEMKRRLLEYEGIAFSSGKVILNKVYY